MDEGLARPQLTGRSEHGFSTPQWVMMVALAMLFLTMILNLVAIQYALGAVQTAVDDAARRGSALDGSIGLCVSDANRTLRGDSGLLTGRMGNGLSIRCAVSGDEMVATATGAFEWWVAGLPAFDFTVEGRSVLEPAP